MKGKNAVCHRSEEDQKSISPKADNEAIRLKAGFRLLHCAKNVPFFLLVRQEDRFTEELKSLVSYHDFLLLFHLRLRVFNRVIETAPDAAVSLACGVL
jgi:hypothetical protein